MAGGMSGLLLQLENCPDHNMTQTRYEIVSTIGVGATSRVDKAHDTLIVLDPGSEMGGDRRCR
jgi:hypothetical protein